MPYLNSNFKHAKKLNHGRIFKVNKSFKLLKDKALATKNEKCAKPFLEQSIE